MDPIIYHHFMCLLWKCTIETLLCPIVKENIDYLINSVCLFLCYNCCFVTSMCGVWKIMV